MANKVEPVPPLNQSIYLYMYRQGLRHVDEMELNAALIASGHSVRQKDWDNYRRGWGNSDLCIIGGGVPMGYDRNVKTSPIQSSWDELPKIDWMTSDCRFIPCSADNKPLISWGKRCYPLDRAKATRGCTYIAENLKGTRHIVIDCDGDHSSELDLSTISFLSKYMDMTHCLFKDKPCDEYDSEAFLYGMDGKPASFHLTFSVDRSVPTMHFPAAHIDILGNRNNQIRYFKNKKWNGLKPIEMTPDIWRDITEYIRSRIA